MHKVILAILLGAMLCGCNTGIEHAKFRDVKNMDFVCINGHIYISSIVHGGYVYTPLFAADTDVPMLIQCPRKQMHETQGE